MESYIHSLYRMLEVMGPKGKAIPFFKGHKNDTSVISKETAGPSAQAPGPDRVRDLQSEVEGVKNIMSQNVERILARGENLDHLRNKTEDLEASSEHFKTTSQKVARKYWWKNAKMIAIICVIVGIIVLLIILLATGVIPT
ncbi:vesicle-associated membrane protein 8 [Hyla sarda]|uniref:vesicle-associated membrane protein 8 n=1 Tax=Hyla sarda TaxID=327740 RepID=UPI0024C267E0|nr:vesicle-associated membrane protein 8 [Hyla sarda]